MLIKRLYEEADLSIEKILTREYQRLSLNSQELLVLLTLFSYYKKRTFSITVLAKKVDMNLDQTGGIIESLLDKQFISFYLETKDGKTRELFSLDHTFDKIEDLYLEDENKKKMDQVENNISKAIDSLEAGIRKPLSAYELEIVRNWYEKQEYDHNRIMELIKESELSGRLSVRYIERLLNQKDLFNVEEDSDADKMLDRIYKGIK
ncbi:predicted DnaD/phage-associated domain protein [Alteracholeplasma palmae J233]|uniref:Predicted DnaD/phage-associated domain protein n=1 Tax=Alteracholeplasma palmae (strain ATCC 49389 / J233) TaxID=1318466 RepID=U4KLM4_ALTPJ|nr:DnaD domain protein [Alteracholeplasma palmae]CCV64773.1 predicted DnaD/phage-associated domain protein [Alteracholeplasma palmae J233]